MRTPIIIANWKMNGNEALLSSIRQALAPFNPAQTQVIICPPFVFLPAAKAQGLVTGAQDVSQHPEGAYTGEISAQMLRAMDCKYVIIGHSERRALCGETDALVAEKFAMAQSAGLIPVLCVGETKEQREAGLTEAIVLAQLRVVVDRVGINALAQALIAYEPIWAIGTGQAATSAQAQAVHHSIRGWLASFSESIAAKVPLLYGGSVNENNARELFSQPDIDGGLIGGASLKPEIFAAIVRATG